jgi:hypothetical protein
MNDDGSINLYICPECKEEYTVFEDMIECWKDDLDCKEWDKNE